MTMTPNGVQLLFVIKNGLPYLEHYYPTERQLNEITREEFMTSRNTWDPTKLDDVDGASDLMISQFSPIPLDVTDSFYNDLGDICATKSESKVDSKVDPAVVDSEVGPAVGDSKVDSKVDPAVVESEVCPAVESEVGPAVVENNGRYHQKPTGEEYRSKPKKKKRNQQQWINNKKIRLKDQLQVPSFPDLLLQKSGPPIKEFNQQLQRNCNHFLIELESTVWNELMIPSTMIATVKLMKMMTTRSRMLFR